MKENRRIQPCTGRLTGISTVETLGSVISPQDWGRTASRYHPYISDHKIPRSHTSPPYFPSFARYFNTVNKKTAVPEGTAVGARYSGRFFTSK